MTVTNRQASFVLGASLTVTVISMPVMLSGYLTPGAVAFAAGLTGTALSLVHIAHQ